MSWDQEYNVESFLSLLIKLTGKHPEEVLQDELHNQGIDIVNREPIVVDGNGFFGPVKGEKITLSDGRVYIPKLVKKFEENGNHGIDYYEYRLENDTPQVVYLGLDPAEEGTDKTVTSGGCGNCDACEQGYGCDFPCDDEGCGCGW